MAIKKVIQDSLWLNTETAELYYLGVVEEIKIQESRIGNCYLPTFNLYIPKARIAHVIKIIEEGKRKPPWVCFKRAGGIENYTYVAAFFFLTDCQLGFLWELLGKEKTQLISESLPKKLKKAIRMIFLSAERFDSRPGDSFLNLYQKCKSFGVRLATKEEVYWDIKLKKFEKNLRFPP